MLAKSSILGYIVLRFRKKCHDRHHAQSSFGSAPILESSGFIFFLILLAILALTTSPARSATNGGSLSGTIKDTTGAVLPGASVRILNISTGIAQQALSNGSGFFGFASLPIGTYQPEIQAKGFEQYRRNGLVINVGTSVRADATLAIGSARQRSS